MFYRKESAMADKNPIEERLAAAVHQAEYAVGQANAAPASAGRLNRIAKADADLLKAGQAYDNCLAGRGYER
jgi:hypothetical protein